MKNIEKEQVKKFNVGAFFALALAVAMVDIDMTAVNLAIATIVSDLKVNINTGQWIVDGYTVAAASMMAVGGRIGDIFGLKKVFYCGLIIFSLLSLAVGISTGALTIISFRVLQGACLAFTFPIALALVRYLFSAQQQGFVVGLLVSIAGFSQALGPTFGSLLISFTSWRWIFLINVPLALLAFFLAKRTFGCVSQTVEKQKVQWFSASLLVVGLLTFITAVNEVGVLGIYAPKIWGLFFIGILLLSLFGILEWRVKEALLDLKLLRERAFLIVNIVRINLTLIYFATLFVISLLLQNVLTYSIIDSGFIMLSITLCAGMLSIPAGKIIDKVGCEKPILWGMLLMLTSSILLSQFEIVNSIYYLLFSLAMAGIGIALATPATGVMAMHSVELKKSGSAMGIFFTNSFFGASLGVALTGVFLGLLNQNHLSALLASTNISLSASEIELTNKLVSGTKNITVLGDAFSFTLAAHLEPLIRESFYYGFSRLMYLCAILAALSSFLIISLSQKK